MPKDILTALAPQSFAYLKPESSNAGVQQRQVAHGPFNNKGVQKRERCVVFRKASFLGQLALLNSYEKAGEKSPFETLPKRDTLKKGPDYPLACSTEPEVIRGIRKGNPNLSKFMVPLYKFRIPGSSSIKSKFNLLFTLASCAHANVANRSSQALNEL